MAQGDVTCGIRRGTTWKGRDGREVQVHWAQVSYIQFRAEDGAVSAPIFHATFRCLFERVQERCIARSRFAMSLINLAHAHIYFDPLERRIIARRADRSFQAAREAAQGAPAVPERAIYVGSYTHPVPFEDFESDLIDVMDRHRLPRLK